MEAIFHEQQDGSLCAQHCLNSLLQGQFYSAVDLADMATELDTMEKLRMAEMGEDTPEYRQFMQQPSTNMDDSGFFSVQVISKALAVWGLDLLPLNSSNPEAARAKNSPIAANAYICNFREHWFTIRRLGSQWFNLNSLLEGPELVSNTYLGEFLAQLQHEGYSIFLVTGDLPPCDADLVLQAVPATQLVPPRLLSDVQSSGSQSRQGRQSAGTASGAQRPAGQTDEEAELEAAMMMSLAETSGTDGGPANIDSDQLARVMEMQRQGGWAPDAEHRGEEDDMELALRMSMTSHTGAEAGGASEEDEIQRAIALSLAGGTGQGVGQSQPSGGGQDGGWGARLRQQEVEEERLYKEEQEKSAMKEQEELEKALAMSMEGASPAPASNPSPASASQIDPVHTAWPRMRNPGEGTLAGHQPGPSTRVMPENPATSVTNPKAASQPQTGPSTSKPSQLVQTSIPENSDRPSLAKTLMPEGPGHRLGGPSFSAAPSGGRAAARPGASGAASGQTKTEDPEEIRRRRMAFLDKLQKSPPSGQNQ